MLAGAGAGDARSRQGRLVLAFTMHAQHRETTEREHQGWRNRSWGGCMQVRKSKSCSARDPARLGRLAPTCCKGGSHAFCCSTA